MSDVFIIAGPCVIESRELCLTVGGRVKSICDKLGLQYIFKASFDKANRSSNSTFRGPGLQDGLVILDAVKRELSVPVLTDIHESGQAAIAAQSSARGLRAAPPVSPEWASRSAVSKVSRAASRPRRP